MITKELQFAFEYFPNSLSFSISKEQLIKEDNIIIAKQRIDTKGFLPGTIEQLIDYIGDENSPIIAFCNATWTPEIIAAQEAINLQNMSE